MHRIDGDNATVTLPAPQAVGATVGYFKAEASPPWTQVTGDWCNAVQEEVAKAIENSGITLSKTNREQLYAAITAALVGGVVSVGAATTLHLAAVLVSQSCGAFGARSLVAASKSGNVNGATAAMLACDLSAGASPGVTGNTSLLAACDGLGGLAEILGVGNAGIASRDPKVAGLFSAILGSSTSEINATGGVIIGSADSKVVPVAGTAPQNSVMLASRFCSAALGADTAAARTYAVAGGYHASALTAPSWRIESQGGTMRSTAAHTTAGLDYAEMFPNDDGKAHAPGRFLTRKGRAAKLGSDGARTLGIVSANPTVVGGDDGIAWAHRYLRDEWGAVITEVVDGLTQPVLNPKWDPTAEQVSRRDRPDEWTCVGLTGQMLVAVDEHVRADDFLRSGEDGIGTRTDAGQHGRVVECMEIVHPFDAEKGYAVALCLIG